VRSQCGNRKAWGSGGTISTPDETTFVREDVSLVKLLCYVADMRCQAEKTLAVSRLALQLKVLRLNGFGSRKSYASSTKRAAVRLPRKCDLQNEQSTWMYN